MSACVAFATNGIAPMCGTQRAVLFQPRRGYLLREGFSDTYVPHLFYTCTVLDYLTLYDLLFTGRI